MGRRLTSVVAVPLLLVGAALPVGAACSYSRRLVSFHGDETSYVYSPVCGVSGCADNFGVSVSSRAVGSFWAIGHGNPDVEQGIDSGSVPLLDGILGLYPGYPALVNSDWNTPGVDGCIDQVSQPACIALVVADRSANCRQTLESCIHVAVATASDPGGNQPFVFTSPDGRIEMTTLPEVLSPGTEEPRSLALVMVPRPDWSAYLDPACQDPLVGYRIYMREPGGGPLPPVTREGWHLPAAGGTTADGGPLPFDTLNPVVFGCDERFSSGSVGVWLAYSLVFADGFELPWVESLDGQGESGPYPDTPDGEVLCCVDVDGDAHCVTHPAAFLPDCDDHDRTVWGGAPQLCGDLKNNDCFHPAWPDLDGTNEADNDGDGLSACAGDCDDGDPSLIELPLLVDSVRFEADDDYLLWDIEPGTSGRIYKATLESGTSAPEFTCVEENGDGLFFDATLPGPGEVFAYLVRAVSRCGPGPLGTDSDGNERVVLAECS